MSGAAVDVLGQIDSLISVAAIEGKFVDADYAMRDAIVELMEAADLPSANIIFRESAPGYVVVPAHDWNRLRAAIRRCQGAQE